MKKHLALLIISLAMAGCTTQPDTEAALQRRIDALYEQLTPGERIAQLRSTYLNEFFDTDGRLDTAKCRSAMPDGIGHFSQFASQMSEDPNLIRDRVAAMQDWLIHNTPSGIPALFHEEVLTGACTRGATVYPQQLGQACSFNTELAEVKAYQTGIALRQIGGLLSLSPMVDVVRTPSFNRLEESFGEDAYLSAALGLAFVNGLQHGDLRDGVGTCSKHFLGYGGGGDAEEKELMEEILLPHEVMIRLGGSQVVMTGYHAVNDTKCVVNSYLQEGILRNYLGFKGMMVSDYGSIDQVPDLETPLERCVEAINAGNDVEFPRGENYQVLQEALDKGLVNPETFERAVKNVLRYKALVGLLDTCPAMYDSGHITFDSPAERETAYQLAVQSIVLLENNGVLPLKPGQKLFLTGPNANSMWAMLGDYTFHSMRYFWQMKHEDDMHPHIVGLKEGLEHKLPNGTQMTYSRGCDWSETVETWIEEGGDQRSDYLRQILNRKVPHHETHNAEEALKLARESDVIIAAMGENVLLSGENRERPTLHLPGGQQEYIEQLIATGKPVVLVVFGGRAQVISEISDRCAAVIQAWYPGEEGGNAVADILLGNVSPSGKLSISYPREEVREPICYNYSAEPDPRVQWPFGYGLSYTTFDYVNLKVDKAVETTAGAGERSGKCKSSGVNLSFEIKNTGSVQADEIFQIYIAPTSPDQPIRPIQLQGFGRVTLKPGQTRAIKVELAPEQFGYYADSHWNIAPGKYKVLVGASSQNIRLAGEVNLTGAPTIKPLRDTYFAKVTLGK